VHKHRQVLTSYTFSSAIAELIKTAQENAVRLTLWSSLRQLTKSVGLFCHDDLDIDDQSPAHKKT